MAEQKPPLIVEFNGEEYEFPAEATDAQISRFLKAIPAANAKNVPKAQTWTAKYPNVAAAARGVVNTLPAVGALVGGVVATPESFGLATVPGAALGAGVGRGARDLIAEATGLDEPTSALSKGGRIALDTAETGALQAVVPGVVEAAKTPLKTISELVEIIPAKGRIAKLLDLERAARQLRLVKPPAAILERPAWQSAEASAAATESPLKAQLQDFAKQASETVGGKPHFTASETALGFKLMKRGLSADDAIQLIKVRRSLPEAWKKLPTDEEVEAIVKQANQSRRMTR